MTERVRGATLRGVYRTELFGQKLELRATLGAARAVEERLGGRAFMPLCLLLPASAFGITLTQACVMLEEFARAGGTELEEGLLEDVLLGDAAEIYAALLEACIASGFLEETAADEDAAENEEDGVPADPTPTGSRGDPGSP